MANIYTITAVFCHFSFFFFAIYGFQVTGYIYNIYKCSFFCFLPSSTYQILLNAIIRHNKETLVNFEPNPVDIFHKQLYINKYYFLAVYRLAVWYTACTFIGSRYTYQQHNCILHAHSLNTCSILIHMVVFVLKKNWNLFLKVCCTNNSISTNLLA